MKLRLSLLLASILSGTLFCSAGAAPPAVPHTFEELKELRLKQLFRREPRAKEYVAPVEKAIAAERARGTSSSPLDDRFNEIIMNAGVLSEDQLREQVDFLADLAGPHVELSSQDVAELEARYKKLCAQLDDQVFIKDLTDVLVAHDRLLDHISFHLWDKQKVASAIDGLEQSIQNAPPIPYGRQELLRSLQDKKLSAPAKGCYVGVSARGIQHLSTFRPSVGVLEESTGTTIPLDLMELSAGRPLDNSQSFSPPPILWVKCRLLEGHVPAITIALNEPSAAGEPGKNSVQDILDGKLDDYFSQAFKLVASTRAATLVGLLPDFDRQADTAFGADGRTPYYLLVDPKLVTLSTGKRAEEVAKRQVKGALLKDTGAELKKYYGDPNLPDGPERVRDAWKHLRSLATAAGAQSVTFYSCAGAAHGNKKAMANNPAAGAQDWNKLEYYWPGEAVLDWVGVADASFDFGKGKQGSASGEQLDQFFVELRSSNWHATPVLLESAKPAHKEPLAEDSWISSCFQELLPSTYPEVKACVLRFPEQLTLWSPDALAAFRRCVSSNQTYKPKLRLVPAAPQQAQSPQ